MPTLKQITCHIELSPSNASLREYDCTYDDGFVDALVAIPDEPAAFCVHLKSSGYIAPGLAMFVFKDGVYQCNRNKIGLRIPTADTPAYLTDVEFRVRQKEDRQGGQRFIGRDWCFEKLNGVSADAASVKDNSDNVGFIEVVVLRCNDKYPDILLHLRRNSSTTAMQMSDDPADISGFYDGPRDDQRYGARYDGNFNERHRPYYYGQRPYDNEDLPFHSPESHMRPQPPTYSRGYSYEARRRRFERAPDDRHMPQEPASRDEFEEFIRWRDSRQSRSGYGTGLSEQPTNTDYYHAVHGQRTRATADMHIGEAQPRPRGLSNETRIETVLDTPRPHYAQPASSNRAQPPSSRRRLPPISPLISRVTPTPMPRFRGLGNPNALAALVHQETSVPETESTLSEINRRPREASNHSSHYAPASAIDPGHSTILGTSQVRSVTWDDKFLPRGFKGSKSIDVAKKNKRYQNDEELSSIPGFEDVTSFGKDRSVTPYRSQVVRDSARNQSTHASSKPFYLEPQHDNKDIVIHSGRRMPGAWSDSEIAEMRQKDDKSILNEGKAAATDQGKNQSQENRNKEASKGTASHAQDEPKQQPASQTQQGGGASVARSIKLGNGPNTGEKQPSKPASRVSSKAPSKRAKDTCSGNAPNADGDGGWDSVKNDTKPTDEQNAQGNTGWGDATGTWSNDTKSTNEQSTQDIANGLGDTTGWGDTAGAENSAEQPGWDTQDNDQQNNTDNAFGWNDDDTNTKAGADTKSDEKNEANVPSNGNWNNASWNADNGGNSANDNGAGWDQVATTNSDPAKMTKIIDATDNGQKKTSDNANSGNAATTNNNNTTNNVQDSSAQPPTSKPKQEETKPTRSRKSVSAKSVPDRYKRSTSYTSGPTPIQQSFVKSYWSQWNAPPSNADLSNAEEKLGKGTEYRHECEKPPYIDTLDKPYAVFMFHFLNKEELSQMLGIEVEVQEGEAEEAAKAEMMNLSKEELVKALLKAKAQPVEKENSPAPAKTSSDSGEKPQVRRQPSPASVQKSEENQKDSGKDPQTSQPTWDQKPQTDQQNSDKKSQASQPDWDKKSQGNQQTQNQNEKAQATGTTPTPTPFADTQAAPAAEEEDEPMTCDHCSDNLGLTWYHCDICNAPDGGYDVCMLCSNKGKRCKDSSHVLDEWMENKDTKVPGPTGLKLAVVADANTANNNAGWDTDANKNDGGNTGGDWANVDTTNNNDSGWDTGANNGDSGNNDAGWGNNDTNNDNTDWNADTNNNDSGNTGGAGWDTNNNAGWDADANKNETGNSAGEGWVDVAGTGWD